MYTFMFSCGLQVQEEPFEVNSQNLAQFDLIIDDFFWIITLLI